MNWCAIHCQFSSYGTDLCTLPGATRIQIEMFREELVAWILLYRCELAAKLLHDICTFSVVEQPLEYVSNETLKQLMQFIWLPKRIEIGERVLPQLAEDLVNIYSMESINCILVQLSRVNMPTSGVIKWSEVEKPHWHTLSKFTLSA
jgi:hypothetical protein